MTTKTEDYLRIEKSILYLDEHFTKQPTLKQVADSAGLSEFHFQRLFKRWAGISPKRFVQYLTALHAGHLLRDHNSILVTAVDAGLSSTSRLHELFVNVHAMTPAQYRKRGRSLTIRYGWHDSPFGHCLVGVTDLGVCWLSFAEHRNSIDAMRNEWSEATLAEDSGETAPVIQQAFADGSDAPAPIPLHLKGTNLQIRVWEALLNIPFGEIVSYSDVARSIQKENAVRAVASAIGCNPVSYIVPCHRVIRKSGALGGYGGGLARKQAMLAWENA